jgi:hypothetical protein
MGGGNLQAIIRALMGMQGGQGGQGMAGGVPTPRFTPGIQPRTPFDPSVLKDVYNVPRDQIEQLLDMDLGGGRTLRTGGGFAGNWRGGIPQGQNPIQQQNPAPPLF